MEFFDDFDAVKEITPDLIFVDEIIIKIKDLRCWVKHFYNKSKIPELSRIKALQRSMNFLLRIFKIVWRDYFYDPDAEYSDEDVYIQIKPPSAERKLEYKELMQAILQLIDWMCLNNRFIFIFNEECGRTNLNFIIQATNKVLGQFRRPTVKEGRMPNMEELTFN